MANITRCGNLQEALAKKEAAFEKADGTCSRCGGCCTRFLPLTRGEAEEIRRFVHKKHIPLIRHGDADIDMLCPFLVAPETGDTSCSIYPVRPKICRLWSCGKWIRKDRQFMAEVGRRCACRPGLIDEFDMHSINGEAEDSKAARMFLYLKKGGETNGSR